MKKSTFNLALATTLMAGTIFTGCQSSDAKVKAAQADVKDAKQDLKKAQIVEKAEVYKYAKAEEWQAFKAESEVKIRDNEIRIGELRDNMDNSGKTLDEIRAKRINDLDRKNKDMKTRINIYEKNQSDWEKFKREFNHDMEALGNAFKDLTIDNNK